MQKIDEEEFSPMETLQKRADDFMYRRIARSNLNPEFLYKRILKRSQHQEPLTEYEPLQWNLQKRLVKLIDRLS